VPVETQAQHDKRMEWWREASFGEIWLIYTV